MFRGLMTEEQKKAFLAMAVKVVMADGKVVPEEGALMDLLLHEFGGKHLASGNEIMGKPNMAVFTDRRSQVICLMELFVLAFSDKRLAIQEVEVLIQEIASEFDLSDKDIRAIHDWAVRQAPLSLEAWGIMTDQDPNLKDWVNY